MVSKDYRKLAEAIRLGPREIARRANTSHVTVMNVLANNGKGIRSKETRDRIHEVIDKEAKSIEKSLARLMRAD